MAVPRVEFDKSSSFVLIGLFTPSRLTRDPTQMIQHDHPVDNIIGSLRKGVITHSHLANFCQHYSFVSPLEPLKVAEALGDPNWVMAMQEELNNFERI